MGGVRTYIETAEHDRSEELIKQYSDMVRQIAYHLLSRLPSNVQVDDLIQAGAIGLLEAGQRYSADRNASFETFASIRIRGAMLDELRRTSWMPRSVHKNMRRIAQAIDVVEKREGREASAKDIAEQLDVSMDEYYAMLGSAHANDLLSLEDVNEEFMPEQLIDSTAYENVMLDDFKDKLMEMITTLPEREQMILSLYYNEKLNFKDIATVLGITEARVCQLHAQVIARLKSRTNRC